MRQRYCNFKLVEDHKIMPVKGTKNVKVTYHILYVYDIMFLYKGDSKKIK